MLTPTIQALRNMGWEVFILLGIKKDDPRYKTFEDIIESYEGIELYREGLYFDVGFYVWGEGERWLPYGDMIKEWKVTKETNNPILHFLNGKHEVELNFTIAEHLGYKEKIPDTYFPTNDFNFVEKAGWTNIAIHVGSRPEPSWKRKRWDIKNWNKLCEVLKFRFHLLKDKKIRFHLLCGMWDEEDSRAIWSTSKPSCNYTLWKGLKITEIAHILSKCDVMVSTDSGPMHIANAVGTPVVQLFGCTLPSKNRGWNDNGGVVIRDKKLKCSPCLYTNKFAECIENICMKSIQPEEVYSHVEKILERELSIY